MAPLSLDRPPHRRPVDVDSGPRGHPVEAPDTHHRRDIVPELVLGPLTTRLWSLARVSWQPMPNSRPANTSYVWARAPHTQHRVSGPPGTTLLGGWAFLADPRRRVMIPASVALPPHNGGPPRVTRAQEATWGMNLPARCPPASPIPGALRAAGVARLAAAADVERTAC